ncbi:MAG: excinuclease ABC subunit UvrC [Methermicoccaceae archaeon]
MSMNDIASQVHRLPTSAGVYLFRDEGGAVLYVGKANSLRDRVSSYFATAKSPKVRVLVSKVRSIEHIIAGSEVEALILEYSLIKRHRPPYNVMFKDDKAYPYIRLTRDSYPRISKTRKRRDDGARYFGPYPSTGAVKRTVETICELFGLRTCSRKLEKHSTPCLKYHIGRCAAPCAGYISREEYMDNVKEACELLEGKKDRTVALLTDKMRQAAALRQFERAARLRDALSTLSSLNEARTLTQLSEDMDIIAVHAEYGMAAVELFVVKRGVLVGREQRVVAAPLGEPEGVLSTFLRYHYATVAPPAQILLSHDIEDREAIEGWLGERKKVAVSMPSRGVKKRLMELALSNAVHSLRYHMGEGHQRDALEQLRDALGLSTLPAHIEGVDIAHTAGRLATASVVVFRDGIPSKDDYRHYRVRAEGGDDPAAIYEVMSRRAARWEHPPDMVLVDGGAPQVSAAHRALIEAGSHVPVFGIAKEHEHLHLPDRLEPVVLDSHSSALHLLMHIRDEAHRFARRYHFRLRQKEHGSTIEQLEGVGRVRTKALIERFGSLGRLKKASVEDISAVKGVGVRTATQIHEQLHPDLYKS